MRKENDRYVISRGLDPLKDQSYVLWGVTQACLSRTMFPVGHLKKSVIREMAHEKGLHELANKSESYEICFIPDNDYRAFLKNRVEGLEERLDGGLFVNKEGLILGNHKGYPFYTIGQRKGLEIAVGNALYVTEIVPETNTVVLGNIEELQQQQTWVRNINLVKYASIDNSMDALTKIRYKDPGTMSAIEQHGDRMNVTFFKPVNGIAPGQSAVFYEGDDLIGGGFIDKVK